MNKPMTWREAQKESFDCAFSKGWWDECMSGGLLKRGLVVAKSQEKMLLVGTEISEAVEDYRVGKLTTTLRPADGKPEGMGTELTDVCIRVWDYLGALGEEEACPELVIATVPALEGRSPVQALHDLMRLTVYAADYAADGTFVFNIRKAQSLVIHTIGLGHALGFDMEKEINMKMAFNRTRPFRHGGKTI
jgi:hypothetical protein